MCLYDFVCSGHWICNIHDCIPTLMSIQVWEGDGVVKSARKLIGATNPLEAEAGTIRGDFAIQTCRNVVHGSDSPENGIREASKHQSEFPVLLCRVGSCSIIDHPTADPVTARTATSACMIAQGPCNPL